MTVEPSIISRRWPILTLLIVSVVLVSCGPVVLPIPTPKPPAPYFDVATLLPDTYLMAAPSLSADGRYLAVGEIEFAGVAPLDLVILDLEERRTLHEVDIDGVSVTQISPSGEYVAADRGYRSSRQLFVFETGVMTPTTVITGSAPAWSPDERRLAYATSFIREDGNWQAQVRLLDLASQEESIVFEHIASAEVYILPLAWSANGTEIAFNVNFPSADPLGADHVSTTLFLLDLEGESATVLARNWEIRSLQFAPDSSKLLFLGAPLPLPRSPRYQLYILNKLGSCHQVPPPFAGTVELALSADGKTTAISVSNPDWLLVGPTSEALPEDFWDSGESCPRLSE